MKFTSPDDAVSFLRNLVKESNGSPAGIYMSFQTCSVLADLIEELASDTIIIDLGDGESVTVEGRDASFLLQQSVSDYINKLLRQMIDEAKVDEQN